MAIEKVLYRAHAHVTGGRDGRATIPESNLDLKLTLPKELGGGGGDGTNPEQLFAARHGPRRGAGSDRQGSRRLSLFERDA